MTTLLLAEHDNKSLKDATNKALTAAKQMGGDVHVLVAGSGAKAVADAEIVGPLGHTRIRKNTAPDCNIRPVDIQPRIAAGIDQCDLIPITMDASNVRLDVSCDPINGAQE